MDTNFNYVKCKKCEHDRNPSTAAKCEICGAPLKQKSYLVPVIAIGLFFLAGLGTAAYLLRNKLPGVSSSTPTANSPSVSSTPASPATTPTSSIPATGNFQIQGAVIQTYQRLADVANVPQGTFNYGGSTTFAPLRSNAVTNDLNQAFPQFQLRYTEPTTGQPGSGKGIEMLIDGQLSFAQSSRPVKDEEYTRAKNRGFMLEEVPVAVDGITLYVSPQLVSQGFEGLTLTQVQDIFTGKATNWNQVGGPDLPIVPFSRNLKAGGTVDFFYEQVLEKQPLGASVQEVRDTTESIRKVSSTPGGISYATASEVINQSTIKLIPIAKENGQPLVQPCADPTCQAVNQTALGDGSYPITRRLFVIIKRDSKLDEQAGVAYANMLLSDEGQALVEQAGFVPIR